MSFSLTSICTFSLLVNSDRTLLWIVPVIAIISALLTSYCLTISGKRVHYDLALVLTVFTSIPLCYLSSYLFSIDFMLFKIVDGFSSTFLSFYVLNVLITFIRIKSPLIVLELVMGDIKQFKSTLFDVIDFFLSNTFWLLTFPLRPIISKIFPLTTEEISLIVDRIIKYLIIFIKLYAYLFSFSAAWWIFAFYLTLVNPAIKYLLLKQGATLFLLSLYHPIYLLIKPLLALL